jgi:hypothetical protein
MIVHCPFLADEWEALAVKVLDVLLGAMGT